MMSAGTLYTITSIYIGPPYCLAEMYTGRVIHAIHIHPCSHVHYIEITLCDTNTASDVAV